jgi:UDP:flavonoid glycosyltransferase YjiC (YdhE family)
MPLAHDQFDNAERVQQLNVGAAIPSNKFDGGRLSAALNRLLNSRVVKDACHNVARRLSPRDGLMRAALALEDQLAQRAQSIGA